MSADRILFLDLLDTIVDDRPRPEPKRLLTLGDVSPDESERPDFDALGMPPPKAVVREQRDNTDARDQAIEDDGGQEKRGQQRPGNRPRRGRKEGQNRDRQKARQSANRGDGEAREKSTSGNERGNRRRRRGRGGGRSSDQGQGGQENRGNAQNAKQNTGDGQQKRRRRRRRGPRKDGGPSGSTPKTN